MIHIMDTNGNTIHTSRNLRGILDHARRVGIERASVLPKGHTEDDEGCLIVNFADGSMCITIFVSYTVLCNWLRARRSWAGTRVINFGDMF
jgi:hypothetical protein